MKADHIAIIRVEQLYPFPSGELQDVLLRYPITSEVLWVQEEPKNMGPWRHVRDYIEPLLENSKRELRYVGRQESASPAAGSLKRFQSEQAFIVEESFAAGALQPKRIRMVPKK